MRQVERTGCPKGQVEERAARALAGLRGELERRHGWAGLELRGVADPRRRTLEVRGEVVTPRVRQAALAALAGALPVGWSVDGRAVGSIAARGLFALPAGLVRLWRAPHTRGPAALCTELVAGDGPVALLAARGASKLVRAGDGTVGWTRARLGPWVEGRDMADPTWPERHAPWILSHALRRMLGAPYRLGGTTSRGVDCSGLVQRCMRALGVVLPRHSTDQLALGAAPVRHLGEPGDLVFLWGGGESACHVGVVLRGERPADRTLVHASSRRGRVVEEPLADALSRAACVRHVELEQVLAQRR